MALDPSNVERMRGHDGGRPLARAPVRVLMAVARYPFPVLGGTERQAHELAKALVEMGVEVRVVAAAMPGGRRGVERVDGIEVHRVSWPSPKWLRALITPLELGFVLLRLRGQYDVVHLHQFGWFGRVVILLCKLVRRPVLTKLPNVGDRGIPGMLKSRGSAVKVAIFKRSDAVIAMCQESIDELDSIGFPRSRILATPNGISLGPTEVTNDSDRPEQRPLKVVFVGRLIKQKNPADLVRAWERLGASVSRPVRLEFWGTGELEPELKQMSRDLGIADTVTFAGLVDEVRNKLWTADILALPSSVEGNSNAILEAMAAGLPIVATDVGGTPMLVGPEGRPLLFRPGEVNSLVDRLVILCRDDYLRRRIGSAMRERVAQHFHIDRIALRYEGSYRCLASGCRLSIGALGSPVITAAHGTLPDP